MTNNSLDILIVDDELAGRGVLKKLLPEVIEQHFNIYEANSVKTAMDIIESKKIDVVFLDIHMPEENGFELLKKLPIVSFETIFVTGFDQYAILAFKFNALDYLLKPVDLGDLKTAINKALLKIAEKKQGQSFITSVMNIIPENNRTRNISIHHKEKVIFLNSSIISHIIAQDNYSKVITYNNEQYTTPRVLKEFEEYFEETGLFVRINRSTYVNISFIESYTKTQPCIVQMKNGEEFEVSRRKKSEILSLLKD